MSKRKSQPASPFFTADDYQILRAERHRLAGLITECDRAEACEIDIADLRRARDTIDRQLALIEQHYMNGAQ